MDLISNEFLDKAVNIVNWIGEQEIIFDIHVSMIRF